MPLVLSGTSGVSQVNGTAAAPAITGTDTDTGIFFPAANTLAFSTNGTEDARFDSAGNFGLGVTPSAWNAIFKAIQVNAQGALMATSASMQMGNNVFYDGAYKFIGTGYANRYYQASGQHVWTVSTASGSAGGTITETQAMTLDASGNLGVGTTSPGYKLNIVEAKTLTPTTGDGQVAIDNSTSGQVSAVLFSSQGTRRAQISSGLGGTGNDGYLAFTTRNDSTGFAERARIDSSGNLLVGVTSSTATPAQGVVVSMGSGSAGVYIGHANGTSSGNYYQAFSYNGSAIGSITQNGTTGVLFNTTSDYRLKTVTGAVSGHGERIDALEPVEYTWNSDGSVARGFLAHKFQEVYPSSVSGEKDAVDEDGNPKYQNMQASTSEVIADLVAEIKSLRIRIAALEA